jgi:hypothetical protein
MVLQHYSQLIYTFDMRILPYFKHQRSAEGLKYIEGNAMETIKVIRIEYEDEGRDQFQWQALLSVLIEAMQAYDLPAPWSIKLIEENILID